MIMFRTLLKHTKISQSNIKSYSTVKDNVSQQSSNEFEAVFSFPFIRYVSVLNRMKIYQLLGTSMAIPGCGILEALNALPPGAVWSASYIGLTGAAVLSLASLPFRNTIGFLYVSQDNEKVKISSMDFWGRRIDKIVPVDDWIPLFELSPKKMDLLYLRPQIADGSEYKLFIKFGNIINHKKMSQVLE